MKEMIDFIVKGLVNFKDDVEITEVTEGNSVSIKVLVNKEDMGKVIGKGGKIANAIRTVARAVANRDNLYVNIKIDEKVK